MPNYCDYIMKVVGNEKNVKAFVNYLGNNYHYFRTEDRDKGQFQFPKDDDFRKYKLHFNDGKGNELLTDYKKHFYRVFEADVLEEGKQDDKYYAIITGDCAWSVYSCMMSGPGSYYSNNVNDNELRKEHSTTLVLESKSLKLKIKVYSAEPGMCFAEHYLIDNGEVIKNEEYDYNEFSLEDYNTKEEAESELGIKITDEEWNKKDYITRCEINPFDPEWNI